MNIRKVIAILSFLLLSGQLSALTYRDGCKEIGGPCDCSRILRRGLPEDCYEGICFQGYNYGDDSVYCQCHGHVLSEAEFVEFKGKGPITTDEACAAVPKYGYDGQGFKKLVSDLKALSKRGKVLFTPVWSFGFMMDLVSKSALLEPALDSVLLTITNDLSTLYNSKTSPAKVTALAKIYEQPDNLELPCDHFKKLLLEKLGLPPGIRLTPEAEAMIRTTCGEGDQQRGNLDPCVCGNTQKPGVCRVNMCVNTGILRCHCD